MHYYKRNIGDYSKKAGRLSILQHGVYNLLIDACYDRERFPTLEEAIDWTWAGTTEEVEAVKFVLSKFFTLENGVYVQGRIQEEIQEYRGFCAKQEARGRLGGRPKEKPKGKDKKPAGLSEEPAGNPDASTEGQNKTLTTNHKPLTTNHINPADAALAEKVYQRVLDVAPKTKRPNLDNWANDIRLMRERDGHTPEEIWSVFLFANSDGFWRTNILSTSKLREKFGTLHAKMTGANHAGSRGTPEKLSNVDRQRIIADQRAREREGGQAPARTIDGQVVAET